MKKMFFQRLFSVLSIPMVALALVSSTRSSAQNIDIDIRSRTLVSPTQLTFEIWMKAGTGYVPQTAPFNNPSNLESNGAWTGMAIRFDFQIADPGVTLASTSQARVSGLSTSGSSVSQAPLAGNAFAIGVTYGRPSDNSVTDLTTSYVKYGTVTVNVTGGSLAQTDVNTIRIGAPPTASTSNWTNAASASTRRQYSPTAASGPLPLTLTDFTARKAADGQRSELAWTTASEQGVSVFEIQRSTNAREWEAQPVSKVKGAGMSSSVLNYLTYDMAPHTGDNYYRLKITDLSGKVSYGPDVRKVNFGNSNNGGIVSVAPNPLNAGSRVIISGAGEGMVDYTVNDVNGKIVLAGTISLTGGNGAAQMDGVSALAAGTYYLNAKGAGVNNQTVKLVKAN